MPEDPVRSAPDAGCRMQQRGERCATRAAEYNHPKKRKGELIGPSKKGTPSTRLTRHGYSPVQPVGHATFSIPAPCRVNCGPVFFFPYVPTVPQLFHTASSVSDPKRTGKNDCSRPFLIDWSHDKCKSHAIATLSIKCGPLAAHKFGDRVDGIGRKSPPLLTRSITPNRLRRTRTGKITDRMAEPFRKWEIFRSDLSE